MSEREPWEIEINDPEAAAEYYKEHVEGTFESKWRFLRQACFSCYLGAVEKFSALIGSWKRGIERGQDPGETCAVLSMNYDMMVSGPIVSSVLMPAFSIEAFIRLCGEAAISGGTQNPELWRLAVQGFDKMNFEGRMDAALKISGVPDLPKNIATELHNLVSFRNDFVHDAPVWNFPAGLRAAIKHGKVKLHRDDASAFGGHYPAIGTQVLSLDLGHAKKSIAIHDGLVDHVLGKAPPAFVEALNERLGTDNGPYHIQKIGTKILDQADSVAAYWNDEVLPWYRGIPEQQKMDFMRTMLRRSKIKLVE